MSSNPILHTETMCIAAWARQVAGPKQPSHSAIFTDDVASILHRLAELTERVSDITTGELAECIRQVAEAIGRGGE